MVYVSPYSAGGINFSDEVLMIQYRLLVKRLESGVLVLTTVMMLLVL